MHVGAYASRPVAFAPFDDGDTALAGLRRSALVDAALADGAPLNGHAGSPVKKWKDEHGSLCCWAAEAPAAGPAVEGCLVWETDRDTDHVACVGRFLEDRVDSGAWGKAAVGKDRALRAKLPEGTHAVCVRLEPGERRLLLGASLALPSGRHYSWCYPSVRWTSCCLECGLPVMSGKLDNKEYCGTYYTIEAEDNKGRGGKVHKECYTAFKAARVEKCLHCSHPVMEIDVDGQHFDGVYYTIKPGTYKQETGGKVHQECYTAFRIEHGEKCAHCGKAVMEGVIGGKHFSGTYYTEKGKKIHEECWSAFKPH